MPLVIRQTVVPLWHYQCPQCGVGSAETGEFAVADMIYCEICIEEGQPTRLRRWPVEEEQSPSPNIQPSEHSR
jgi:hypothetical protein